MKELVDLMFVLSVFPIHNIIGLFFSIFWVKHWESILLIHFKIIELFAEVYISVVFIGQSQELKKLTTQILLSVTFELRKPSLGYFVLKVHS